MCILGKIYVTWTITGKSLHFVKEKGGINKESQTKKKVAGVKPEYVKFSVIKKRGVENALSVKSTMVYDRRNKMYRGER